jgi:hypothetical protein
MNYQRRTATIIMRETLKWACIIIGLLAVVAAGVGYLVAGLNGLWSGLAGVLLAGLFFGLTALMMLIAARLPGDQLMSTAYFAVVMGGWFVKVIVFIIGMLVLRAQPWIVPWVFFFSAIAGALASLIVDIVVFARVRVPYVGEVPLPGDQDDSGQPPSDS